jgi:hypothetical protein
MVSNNADFSRQLVENPNSLTQGSMQRVKESSD